HIFAVGYMSHDPERRRFFGYMNLFVASMLLLVLADNYLVLYVGWEGVGLASYLLIGFWQVKPAAAVAAKKAFVANRVGDARLAVTILGAATLLFGALISCAKDDIKKALAGSTMSQIGYMMLAAGLGPAGYPFAIALLLAHGFFKAGLFLGAGSVKHEMND